MWDNGSDITASRTDDLTGMSLLSPRVKATVRLLSFIGTVLQSRRQCARNGKRSCCLTSAQRHRQYNALARCHTPALAILSLVLLVLVFLAELSRHARPEPLTWCTSPPLPLRLR